MIEGLVSKPESAYYGQVFGDFELEFVIYVSKVDRQFITEEVCLALAKLLRVKTGGNPVVYLEDESSALRRLSHY